MCGTRPSDHCALKSVSSSHRALSRLTGASPIATNALSQLHWCGYSRGAGLVQSPRSLRASTARAALRNSSAATGDLGGVAVALRDDLGSREQVHGENGNGAPQRRALLLSHEQLTLELLRD